MEIYSSINDYGYNSSYQCDPHSLHWCSRWSYSMPHTQIPSISFPQLPHPYDQPYLSTPPPVPYGPFQPSIPEQSRPQEIILAEWIDDETKMKVPVSVRIYSDMTADVVFDEMPHCHSMEFEHSTTAATSSELIPDLDYNDKETSVAASIDSTPLVIASEDTKSKIEGQEALSIDSNFTDYEEKCDSLFLDCIREINPALVPFNTWMGMCLQFEKSRVASSLFDKMIDSNGAYMYSLISENVTAQHMLHHFPYDPGSAAGLVFDSVAHVFDNSPQYLLCTALGAMSEMEYGKNHMVRIAGQIFDTMLQRDCCSKVLLDSPSVAKLLTPVIISGLGTVSELFNRHSQRSENKSLDSFFSKDSLLSFSDRGCLVQTAPKTFTNLDHFIKNALKHCLHNDPYPREIFATMFGVTRDILCVRRSCVKPREQTKAIPIVLLHDFASSCLEWCYPFPLLEEGRLEIWAVDILGWGSFDLDRPPLRDLTPNCDHLYSLWTTNIKRPMVLVGPSLGSFLALDFSVKYLEVVHVLILIDASVPAHGKPQAVIVIGCDLGGLCCAGLNFRHDLELYLTVLQLEYRNVAGDATRCFYIEGYKLDYVTLFLCGFHSRRPQETQLAQVLDALIESIPCANYDLWIVYVPGGEFLSIIGSTKLTILVDFATLVPYDILHEEIVVPQHSPVKFWSMKSDAKIFLTAVDSGIEDQVFDDSSRRRIANTKYLLVPFGDRVYVVPSFATCNASVGIDRPNNTPSQMIEQAKRALTKKELNSLQSFHGMTLLVLTVGFFSMKDRFLRPRGGIILQIKVEKLRDTSKSKKCSLLEDQYFRMKHAIPLIPIKDYVTLLRGTLHKNGYPYVVLLAGILQSRKKSLKQLSLLVILSHLHLLSLYTCEDASWNLSWIVTELSLDFAELDMVIASIDTRTRRLSEAYPLKNSAILILVVVRSCQLIRDSDVIPFTHILLGVFKVNHPKLSDDTVMGVATILSIGDNQIWFEFLMKVSLTKADNSGVVSLFYGLKHKSDDNLLVFDPGGDLVVPFYASPSNNHASLPIQRELLWETVVLKLDIKEGNSQFKSFSETAGVVDGKLLLELSLNLEDTRDIYLIIEDLILPYGHIAVDGNLKHPWNKSKPSRTVGTILIVHHESQTEAIVGYIIFDSNLEDKVLLQDGRNVMNVIKMADPFGKMANYVWDPGK